MTDELVKRKENLFSFLKTKTSWIYYLGLIITVWFGYFIRTRNLKLLNGKYLLALDPYLFYRYAQYILEHGKLFVIDTMRYVPGYLDKATMQLIPYYTGGENILLSYIIVYVYKFLHFFNKSITLMDADIVHPAIFFILAAIAFFFLVKRLFNTKIALLSTFTLTIIPTFLFRTMSGYADKEPAGIFFMFSTLLFYVLAWQSKNLKSSLIFGFLSGIFTGLLGLVWGGVQFVTITIPLFVLIELFLGKIEKKDFYIYALWSISMIAVLLKFTPRYNFTSLISSFATGISLFVLFILISDFLLFKLNYKFNIKLKEKLKEKLPQSITSLIVAFIFIIILSSIIFDISFVPNQIREAKSRLIYPMGMNRFVLTVAEAHQPFFVHWWNDLHWFFYLFFISSVFLFYKTIRSVKKHKWWLTVAYTLFLSFFIFSRYDQSSRLNGTNSLSVSLYLGSLIFFVLLILVFYLYTFYKNKEVFNELLRLDKKYTFIFVWFLLMVVAARGALRFFFVSSPIWAILGSVLLINIAENWKKLNRFLIFSASWLIIAIITGFMINNHFANILVSGALATSILFFKEKNTKKIINMITAIVVIFLFVFAPFISGSLINFTRSSYNSAKFMGPGTEYQWQKAMDWVDANLPKDAVFAHWWDYGYWVQSMGHRATILDGGNARGYWNHLMGRYVLTGQNEKEALEFLKTHNATHLTIIVDEIGKYPAYSSIGSDANYDRYSQISTFMLDPSQIQETRNEMIYVYKGSFPLDEDLVYQNQLYPRGRAGIAGFLLPIKFVNESVQFSQPVAALIYQGRQINIPLECIFFNGQEYNFESKGIKGCLRIIPVIQDNQVNELAAGLYVSEKVRRTLFTQIYLFEKKWPSFEEIYNDKNERPLLIYNGVLIGPLKIWKINYPLGIEWKPEYLTTDYPAEVI